MRDRGCVNHEYAGRCAGTEEDRGKGGTPKGQIPCRSVAWAWGEEPHDCHLMQMKLLSGKMIHRWYHLVYLGSEKVRGHASLLHF